MHYQSGEADGAVLLELTTEAEGRSHAAFLHSNKTGVTANPSLSAGSNVENLLLGN